MRDITSSPIAFEDITAAIERGVMSSTHRTNNIIDDDALAFGYLQSFLSDTMIERLLRAHLEKQQPKPKNTSLEKLEKATLQKLLHGAIWDPFKNKKPDEIYIWKADYRGISTRGSYVYDINGTYPNEIRLYVRRDKADGELRGEVNEDNFQYDRKEIKQPEICAADSKSDEPISATMTWWQNIVRCWRTND